MLALGLWHPERPSPLAPTAPPPFVLIEVKAPPVEAAAAPPAPAAAPSATEPISAPSVLPSAPKPARVAKPRPAARSTLPASAPTVAAEPMVAATVAGTAGAHTESEAAGTGSAGTGIGPGLGASGSGHGRAQAGDAIAAYLADVRARLQRGLVYPPKARRVGLQGAVHLRLRILADGTIAPDSVVVVGEGAHPLLVAGAMETLRVVALGPPPLPEMEVTAPLQFRIE